MAKVVAVRDEGGPGGPGVAYSYSQARIASVLALMGVRGEHAAKIAKTVLRRLLQEAGGDRPGPGGTPPRVSREAYDRVCWRAMAEFGYDRPVHAADFRVASSLRERRSSVCVLLCGTSGTGKSTMASLLASRLGIATVLSTDSIRHMLRSFSTPEAQPLIWASTYKAGDCISLAPEKLAAKKYSPERLARKLTLQGYKAQSELVVEQLEKVIAVHRRRHESLVVEGVHLNLSFIAELMRRHPNIVPFLVYISNEAKHKERFAVRAKYMSLQSTRNRYVKYFRNIRHIQEYLCKRADKLLVPKVDNTNLDRTLATIHATLVGVLRQLAAHRPLLHEASGTAAPLHAEHARSLKAQSWSSKGMLEVIQRRLGAGGGSSATPSTSSAVSAPAGLDAASEAAAEDGYALDARSFHEVDQPESDSDEEEEADDDDNEGGGEGAGGGGDGGGGDEGGSEAGSLDERELSEEEEEEEGKAGEEGEAGAMGERPLDSGPGS